MARAPLDRRLAVALAAAGLLVTTAISAVGYVNILTWSGAFGSSRFSAWTDAPLFVDTAGAVAGGWAFGLAGMLAMYRRPASTVGLLMVLVGAALLTRYWTSVPVPLLVSIGLWAMEAPLILLGILVLGYPTGRVASRAARVWVGLALVDLLGIQVARALYSSVGVWDCPDCRPLVTLSYDARIEATIYYVGVYALLLLAAGLIGLLVRQWATASRPARRQLAPVWLAGVGFAGVALTISVLDSTWIAYDAFTYITPPGRIVRLEIPERVVEVMTWVWAASLLLLPFALVVGLVRSHLGQAAVSALAVELRGAGGRPPLVESLRRALADGTLELGLWSRPAATYVTPDGLPLDVPEAAQGRGVTRLEGTDGPLAIMIHDAALSEQPALVDGVGAVAQLALENERLHAEVKAQLEEVRASRARIVTAADEERRRVERNIHDGAQQRLVSLALALSMAHAKAAEGSSDVTATLADAEAELKAAMAELRELARGIHPAILTEAGLGPALDSLADHSPVPVDVDAHLDGGRLPPLVEATAYFVASEALTNVAKHAAASSARIRATVDDGWLRLEVIDDGAGGADPSRGSGLRGLVDRVAALGGKLRVADTGPRGTRVEALIPCASGAE